MEANVTNGGSEDDVIVGEDDDLVDTATSSPELGTKPEDSEVSVPNNSTELGSSETDKSPEWVEWRETSDSGEPSDALPNGELQTESPDAATISPSSSDPLVSNDEIVAGHQAELSAEKTSKPSELSESGNGNACSDSTTTDAAASAVGTKGTQESAATIGDKEDDKEGN